MCGERLPNNLKNNGDENHMRKYICLTLAIPLVLVTLCMSSYAKVFFQNTGTVSGWSSPDVNPLPGQNKGTTTQVSSPSFGGQHSLKATQIYDPVYSKNSGYTGGYHAEVVLFHAESVGQDRYFGQAIMLPSNWAFHNSNDTFEQFSPESPSGPWILNWVQNNHLFIRVGSHVDLGAIQKGVWTRIVARFKLGNPGTFEYWVNGNKVASLPNINLSPPNGATTIRWSVGIYCTAWRNHIPPDGDIFNQLTRTIYHDHLRIASTYAEAEPANWH